MPHRMTRVALVTGASSGIGTAIARRLAADSYSIMAAGRDAARTEALGLELKGLRTWIGDLADSASCNRLVAACVDAFGGLDLLVNNAGIWRAATVEETTDQLWSDMIACNLSSAFFLSRAAIPHLRRRKGAIVNIASNWGLVGGPRAVAYCASKGGMVLMTRAMTVDHAAEGVRINAVCPGDVETPMLYQDAALRGLNAEAALAEANAASRTGRVTSPEEVAALVAFLASDEAAQINGAAIPIDGGGSA